MAEILMRAVDNTSGHPLAWKRGMPIVVFEDGHVWGAAEVIPPAQGGKFVILKVTDVTKDQVDTFIFNRWGFFLCDPETAVVTIFPEPIRRRQVAVLVASLPLAVRQEMNQTGSYTTTWPQIKAFIQRIATGEMF